MAGSARSRPSDVPGEPLDEYRRRRDFAATTEPRGAQPSRSKSRRFVVQKHAARRLHYDLRLEVDGVLKSWAVTRGPSLDPRDKRLAVEVEDHPIDYGDFEGVIPEGLYGAGTVMLWDHGEWEPDDATTDVDSDLAAGKLKFSLHGRRLKGGWMLVRMRGRNSKERRHNWLLVKENDRAAKPGDGDRTVESYERSVVSRRTMRGIANARERVWQPDAKAARTGASVRGATRSKRERAAAASLPEVVAPQLATRVEAPPRGSGWVYEIKFDGYRLACRLAAGKVTLSTRNGKDWSRRFSTLARSARAIAADQALIDGEAVVLDGHGRTDFGALQAALSRRDTENVVYMAFDLLHLDGEDLRALPLVERKARLEALLASVSDGSLRYSEHVEADGPTVLAAACDLALEGMICKRADAPYRSGRGRDWLKVKCGEREEFVIVGFTLPKGRSRSGLGALALATHEDGRLAYAGRVGTGFDARMRDRLRAALDPIEIEQPPLEGTTATERRGVRWVRPQLIAEIAFAGWTSEGRVRHASFQGLREDKTPAEVEREAPRMSGQTRKGSPSGQRDDDVIAGVEISSPDKVLYPRQGITKHALARYYEAVAEHMLPHLVERPLMLLRCPQGRQRKCFVQRHLGDGMGENVVGVPVDEEDGTVEHVAIETISGLIRLVQMGVLEIHPWGSRRDALDKPDRLILDLDPAEDVGFADVMAAAREIRDRLRALGLESFVKTTGGKGLHVTVPILRRHDWREAKAFTRALAEAMVDSAPERYTAQLRKSARKGKIFIDYLRNDRGATAIAPYSSRAREGGTVALPVSWDELGRNLDPTRFTVATVPALVAKRADPWAKLPHLRQSITVAAKRELTSWTKA